MLEHEAFDNLIAKVRSGDESASAELVARFEPYVLRVVRFRMRHRGDYERLRHEVSSVDVCQDVFMSLFGRLRDGRFDLAQATDLHRLLAAMVRFKVASRARIRGVAMRELLDADGALNQPSPGPTPEQRLEDQELSEAVLRLFPADEIEVLSRRLDGQSWPEIARELGESAPALRKRLERRFARIRRDYVSDLTPRAR